MIAQLTNVKGTKIKDFGMVSFTQKINCSVSKFATSMATKKYGESIDKLPTMCGGSTLSFAATSGG